MALPEDIIHPGDIVQDAGGLLYLVSEKHGWGYGCVQRWQAGQEVREAYHRLKHGQIVVVGHAHMLPEDVNQRRRDSIETQRLIEQEAGQ